MAVTYADIAERAGTSTAVVSYVLNDGPRPVAAATRARVLAAAQDLGYRPNRIAAALRSGSTGLIGVLTPDSTIPYFGELTRALVAALGADQRFALVSHADLAGVDEAQALERLLSAQVDGVLVTAYWPEQPLPSLADRPVVYVHHKPAAVEAPLVESDNDVGVHRAFEHLRSHGHERIAFWSGPDDEGPTGQRMRAWLAAAGGSGGPLFRSGYESGAAAAEFAAQHARGAVPTALLVATDQQAVGILSAAYQLGVRVPHELAIISLDGTRDSEFTAPPLTVVRQPVEAMAAQAVALLGDPQRPVEAALGELIIRRSCGCDA